MLWRKLFSLATSATLQAIVAVESLLVLCQLPETLLVQDVPLLAGSEAQIGGHYPPAGRGASDAVCFHVGTELTLDNAAKSVRLQRGRNHKNECVSTRRNCGQWVILYSVANTRQSTFWRLRLSCSVNKAKIRNALRENATSQNLERKAKNQCESVYSCSLGIVLISSFES